MTITPDDDAAERRSRWPRFDLSLVLLLLIALVLLLTFTFEIWAPHPSSHSR